MAKKTKIANDNISELLGNRIPDQYKDSDEFLDIISWNLRWFNSMEKKRADKIYQVIATLNADLFVFQEVEDESLDGIRDKLNEKGLGSYRTHYGKTGGNQRIAFMYDFNWVRAKDNLEELFGKKTVITPSGKDVFPRLPLWGYFYTRSISASLRGFDFQVAGLHLKSQLDKSGTGEDKLQRELAARRLATWLEHESIEHDSDSILIGDWNESPDKDTWDVFGMMENENKVAFRNINDPSDFSHLYYKNRINWGSRLDLAVVSSNMAIKMKGKPSPILWLSLEELIESDASAGQVKAIIKEIKDEVTDHLPVHNRFYLAASRKKK